MILPLRRPDKVERLVGLQREAHRGPAVHHFDGPFGRTGFVRRPLRWRHGTRNRLAVVPGSFRPAHAGTTGHGHRRVGVFDGDPMTLDGDFHRRAARPRSFRRFYRPYSQVGAFHHRHLRDIIKLCSSHRSGGVCVRFGSRMTSVENLKN